MKKRINLSTALDNFFNKLGLEMRTKLIIIFLFVKIIPLVLVMTLAVWEFINLGSALKEIAVRDSSAALNNSAIENIERMTTDTAQHVADFLYARDYDIIYMSGIEPSEENYRRFIETKTGRVIKKGEWGLSEDGKSWTLTTPLIPAGEGGVSSNPENDDMDGFNYRYPESFEYENIPLYDEITFIDLDGNETVKVIAEDSPKVNYPMSREKKNISIKENTYIKAENYFEELKNLKPGEIYVSDVTGAYVGSNYIGMYTPDTVSAAAQDRGYDIEYLPESQAYAGMENPNGQRFEGIVRWATPVTDDGGNIIGYVSFALNHDHIMEFVDHLTPMNKRYTQLPSAFEGNYAFIWDYKCRSICHPRHHSIVGFDPETGDPQIPWLENSIYEGWQESGIQKWTDFVEDYPAFFEQSRSKKPSPFLTQNGLVGLDGRYLNNAPQCTGWMDLTQNGGSGSFYILWSGLYKLTTAAAIPYYTGHYAPSDENNYSRRGFGFVAIGAGLEDFTSPARDLEKVFNTTTQNNLTSTLIKLISTAFVIIVLVVFIAFWLASFITNNITKLIEGIAHFRAGERQFRFRSTVKDEFGTLADSFDDMADSIVDSVKTPLSITDMNRNIIYMNEYGLQFNGKTLDEIVGKLYNDYSAYPVDTQYCPIKALHENREAEVFYHEADGRYLKGTANYFLNKDGEKIGYIISTADVTEMLLERMKIEEQRTLLDKVFSVCPDLIWYQDAKGVYLAVNPRFAAIAGKRADEFVGKTTKEMLPPDIAENFAKNDLTAISSLLPLYTEERITFADGHEEILDSVRSPVYDASGNPLGLLGFMRDVTVRVTIENELRKTQIDLEQAVNDANRANEHKGEFLARMSHEIRTPMNAIIGITGIVLKKLGEEYNGDSNLVEIKTHISQIEVSSQHLLGLLNDILDLSKIEAGKIELSEEEIDLAKLAHTVTGIIKPRCDEKNITFNTVFDFEGLPAFLSDSLRLRQVLINLLGNAVKFTPNQGTIEFRCEKKERRDGMTLIEFSVRDNGIGISEEAIETIFKPFEQGNGSVTRRYGGTGLGLSISRSIIQLFGGDITVRSKIGEGSEFSFSIWLKETESLLPGDDEIADITGKFTGKKMLLVDDVDLNRMIVVSMLENTGLEIDEAADGIEALKYFENSEINEYDIIFMDVQMPNMDGYEASMTIRSLDRPDANTVPIIALTANAFKEDIDKALQQGMNAHIAKPIEMDKLWETLFKYLNRQ